MSRHLIVQAFMAALLFAGPALAAPNPEEIKAICAEAEERFKEMAGDKPIPPNTVVVKMYKYVFCPGELTIKAGTSVRWVNVEKRTSHDVWFKEEGKEPGDRIFPGEVWEMTFPKPGTYPYLCAPHWQQEGMKATIKVVE